MHKAPLMPYCNSSFSYADHLFKTFSTSNFNLPWKSLFRIFRKNKIHKCRWGKEIVSRKLTIRSMWKHQRHLEKSTVALITLPRAVLVCVSVYVHRHFLLVRLIWAVTERALPRTRQAPESPWMWSQALMQTCRPNRNQWLNGLWRQSYTSFLSRAF